MKFERDQKLGVSVDCQAQSYWQDHSFQLEKNGYWKVEDNKVCLELSLTAENLIEETNYIKGKGRAAFERPYGIAWLLQLVAELEEQILRLSSGSTSSTHYSITIDIQYYQTNVNLRVRRYFGTSDSDVTNYRQSIFTNCGITIGNNASDWKKIYLKY